LTIHNPNPDDPKSGPFTFSQFTQKTDTRLYKYLNFFFIKLFEELSIYTKKFLGEKIYKKF